MKKLLSMVLLVAMCVSLFPAMVGSAAVATPSAEMLLNPGMVPQEGEDQGWYNVLNGDGLYTFSTDEKHGSDDYSMLTTQDTRVSTAIYDFDPAKAYEFSIWVKGDGRLAISVPCYDEEGKALAPYNVWDPDANMGTKYIYEATASYADWTQKKIYISAGGFVPAEAKKFRVLINTLTNANGGNALYFDDASLVSYDLGANVDIAGAVNPNPAMGVAGTTDRQWVTLNTASFDNEEYHSAPVSLKTEYTGTRSYSMYTENSSAYSLTPEQLYECSVWMKTDTATNARVQVLLQGRLSWNNIPEVKLFEVNPTTEWRQYKTYFYPETVNGSTIGCGVKIYVVADGTAGNIWVDDVVVRKAEPLPDGEMLLDPDMEQRAVGWIDQLGHLANAKISYTNEEAHSGAKSILASTSNNESSWFTTPAYDFDASKAYKFSIWVKGSGRIIIGVPCYDENGNPISSGYVAAEDAKYGVPYVLETNADYTDWTQKTIYISAGGFVPSTTKKFGISVRTLYASGSSTPPQIYYDDASLVACDLGVETDIADALNMNPALGATEAADTRWMTLKNASLDNNVYHTAPVGLKSEYTGTSSYPVFVENVNGLKLTEGQLYEYSVWMKTDTATDARVQGLVQGKEAWNVIREKKLFEVNPTTEWKQFKTYFYPEDIVGSTNGCGVKLYVVADGTPGNIWIDDVVIKEADAEYSDNLLKDPGMSGSLTYNGNWGVNGWGTFSKTENHTGDAGGGSAELKFNKDEATTVNLFGSLIGTLNESDVNVENYVALDTTKEYELTFWAKGTEGEKSMFHVLMSPAINGQTVVPGYGHIVYPTTEWKQYKFIIDAGLVADYAAEQNTTNNYTPYFSIRRTDGFEGAVYIDDVTLCVVDLGYADDLGYVDTESVKVTSVADTAVAGKAYFNTAQDIEYIVAVYSGNIVKDIISVKKSVKAGNDEISATLNKAAAAGDIVKIFAWSADGELVPVKVNAIKPVQ